MKKYIIEFVDRSAPRTMWLRDLGYVRTTKRDGAFKFTDQVRATRIAQEASEHWETFAKVVLFEPEDKAAVSEHKRRWIVKSGAFFVANPSGGMTTVPKQAFRFEARVNAYRVQAANPDSVVEEVQEEAVLSAHGISLAPRTDAEAHEWARFQGSPTDGPANVETFLDRHNEQYGSPTEESSTQPPEDVKDATEDHTRPHEEQANTQPIDIDFEEGLNVHKALMDRCREAERLVAHYRDALKCFQDVAACDREYRDKYGLPVP